MSQLKKIPTSATDLSQQKSSSGPKNTSQQLVLKIQQDIIDSIVQIISETQQESLKNLSEAAEVLLSTQFSIQKVDKCLKLASTTSREIDKKLNDIMTYNFIPSIFFGPQLPSPGKEK